MESYVSTKGQVVIPAALRRKYGIQPGTRIRFIEDGGRIVLEPVTPAYVRSQRGSLPGKGALKVLREERRRERDR